MLQGDEPPEIATDIGVLLMLLFTATTATVPSTGFLYAVSSTPAGTEPDVPTRTKPGRTNRL
jgi:hypothetical protein